MSWNNQVTLGQMGTTEVGKGMVQRLSFMKETPLFAEIKESMLSTIAEDIKAHHYQQGEVIFREGDSGHSLYLVKSGQVRIFVNGLDGHETSVILFGRPGEIFGELAIIDGLPRSATAIALGQTVLYTMNRDAFRHHMVHCPQLSLNFMRELSMRVRYNTRQMDSLASLGISQRLARKLIELAKKYGVAVETGEVKGVCIDMALTQSDLASLVGATRESINKSLSEFRRQKLILYKNGKITICNPDALRARVSV